MSNRCGCSVLLTLWRKLKSSTSLVMLCCHNNKPTVRQNGMCHYTYNLLSYHQTTEQGRAHDYREAGAQSQERAVHVRAQCTSTFFSGYNNTICRLINVKLINKVLIES